MGWDSYESPGPYGLAMHAGDLDRAKALLANPPTSWEIHASVVWEAARTRQLLAAALGGARRHDEADVEQSAADETLQALGVVKDRVVEAAIPALRSPR